MSWFCDEWDGEFWVTNAFIFPNPGDKTISLPVVSTSKKVQLVDGSFGRITPQIKSNKEDINWTITQASSTTAIREKIELYISLHQKVRITTHTGEQFEGYFKSLDPIMELSGKTQRWTLNIAFERSD